MTEPVAMQQRVHAGEAVEHVELLGNPLPQVFSATNPLVWITGGLGQVLDDGLFGFRRQMPMIAPTLIDQTLQTLSVVALHPRLHRASRHLLGCRDLRRRGAPHRLHHDAQPIATPRLTFLFHEPLKFRKRLMSDHMHAVDLRVIDEKPSMPHPAQWRNRTSAEHAREIKMCCV